MDGKQELHKLSIGKEEKALVEMRRGWCSSHKILLFGLMDE